MGDNYIGASCLVEWLDDGTDNPENNPFTAFIKFGSYDDETATDAERVADLDVFYYCDNLAELETIYAGELACEFVIVSYELVKGE